MLKETHNNSLEYEIELTRVEKEIWSSLDVKGLTVIDLGVENSTRKLVELGARVIGVDSDFKRLRGYKDLDVELVNCDVANLPFGRKIADLSVFYFTLHEIDPRKHEDVLSVVYEISSKVMIVEPSPEG